MSSKKGYNNNSNNNNNNNSSNNESKNNDNSNPNVKNIEFTIFKKNLIQNNNTENKNIQNVNNNLTFISEFIRNKNGIAGVVYSFIFDIYESICFFWYTVRIV